MSALDHIRIVLIDTTHPGNIGGAARAMKNMGLSQLYLVSPRQFPDSRATDRAAGATDLLDKAVVVSSVAEAVADCSLIIGTSARDRRIPWPLLNPRACAEQVTPQLGAQRVAILFGREDRGLTNEELQLCHLHVHIPADESYSSLNLAMAVQVISYELRMAHLAGELSDDSMSQWDIPMAPSQDIERFFVHLEDTLVALGFLDPQVPKQLMTRLRRLFARTRLDSMEVNILRGILTSARSWVDRARVRETPESPNDNEASLREPPKP